MLTVPLALVGGLAALQLRGMTLNVSSAVGFIALFGVAVQKRRHHGRQPQPLACHPAEPFQVRMDLTARFWAARILWHDDAVKWAV